MVIEFKKAARYQAKARVSLVGPSGSGKSLTMLKLARLLAGPNGRIGAADTESGSLSKYAPAPGQPADNVTTFDFDVIELQSFSPQTAIALIDEAERLKLDVLCIDSFSHFWMGRDGALEFVDARKSQARAKGGDYMDGWKDYRPEERMVLQRMIASPCHILVTMRTKTEYRIEEYEQAGKKKERRVKIGLAPVQRDSLEYEFDLCLMMTDDNEAVVDKTRCSEYAGRTFKKPSAKDFQAFANWLAGAERPAAKPPVEEWRVNAQTAFDSIAARVGAPAFTDLLAKHGYASVAALPDRETAGRVFRAVEDAAVFLPRLTAAGSETNTEKPAPPEAGPAPAASFSATTPGVPTELQLIWSSMTSAANIKAAFMTLRASLAARTSDEAADTICQEVLARHGVESPQQFKSVNQARKCARDLWLRLNELAVPAEARVA